MRILVGEKKKAISGSIRDLFALTDWCKSLLSATLPSDEVEEKFKKITMKDLIDLWQ